MKYNFAKMFQLFDFLSNIFLNWGPIYWKVGLKWTSRRTTMDRTMSVDIALIYWGYSKIQIKQTFPNGFFILKLRSVLYFLYFFAKLPEQIMVSRLYQQVTLPLKIQNWPQNIEMTSSSLYFLGWDSFDLLFSSIPN